MVWFNNSISKHTSYNVMLERKSRLFFPAVNFKYCWEDIYPVISFFDVNRRLKIIYLLKDLTTDRWQTKTSLCSVWYVVNKFFLVYVVQEIVDVENFQLLNLFRTTVYEYLYPESTLFGWHSVSAWSRYQNVECNVV